MEIKHLENRFLDIIYKTDEKISFQYATVSFRRPGEPNVTKLDVTPESIDRIVTPLLELGAEITIKPKYIESAWAMPDIDA